MLFVRIIKYFYLSLTILAFLSPTFYSVYDFLPGIVLMWIFFYVFIYAINKNNVPISLVYNEIDKKYFVLLAFLFFIFYPFYVKFYTGTSLFSSILSVGSGISNYYNYQSNFAEKGLGQFSLNKLPFILGHGVLKFYFLYLFFNYYLFHKKKSILVLYCLISMFFVFALVGIARGTSFEVFEIFNYLLFSFVIKRIQTNVPYIFNIKSFVVVCFFAVILIMFFMNHIVERYSGNFDFSSLSSYNNNSFISTFSPFLSILLFSLYGYFTFGLHFTSTIFYNLWFNSIDGFFTIFFRDGIQLFSIGISYRDYANNFIDVGAQWTPDIISLFQNIGLLGGFLFIFFLGFFSRLLLKKISYSVTSVILLFFSYFYMISLPIGNFVSVSSSNQICIFLGIAYLLLKQK